MKSSLETAIVKDHKNNTYYMDLMTDNTYSIFKDEVELKNFEFAQDALEFLVSLTPDQLPPCGRYRGTYEILKESRGFQNDH